MCQTTHLKILDLVTFSDLTLTLTWAKYETISLVSTFAWSLGVHMESFGRNMLRLRSQRSAWPQFQIFESGLEASRRDLSNAASSVSLRPSVFEIAGESDPTPPPPGCGGYRNSPGGGGLRSYSLRHFRGHTTDLSLTANNSWLKLFKPIMTIYRWSCNDIAQLLAITKFSILKFLTL